LLTASHGCILYDGIAAIPETKQLGTAVCFILALTEREKGVYMRRLYLILIILMAAGTGLVTGVFLRRSKPAIERIAHEQHRVTALAELLATNRVGDLPPKFNFWANPDKIECFSAKDKDSNLLKLVKVTYRVGPGNSASVSFVFDSSGKCIFSSRDRKGFWNGGLYDITGDGYMEKVVQFSVEPVSRGSLTGRLQVFRIGPDSYRKLLDIGYASWTGEAPDDSIQAEVWPPGFGREYAVRVFRYTRPEEELKIMWSAEKNAKPGRALSTRKYLWSGARAARCVGIQEERLSREFSRD
jgi:hypothetical protein